MPAVRCRGSSGALASAARLRARLDLPADRFSGQWGMQIGPAKHRTAILDYSLPDTGTVRSPNLATLPSAPKSTSKTLASPPLIPSAPTTV